MVNKLMAWTGGILTLVGIVIMLTAVPAFQMSMVSFGGAEVSGISEFSAVRLFTGIVVLLVGIGVLSKAK